MELGFKGSFVSIFMFYLVCKSYGKFEVWYMVLSIDFYYWRWIEERMFFFIIYYEVFILELLDLYFSF